MFNCRLPIIVLLRVTVALQCLGHARWILDPDFGETPILSLLWGDPEFGGLGWSESAALAVQQVAGWLLFAAALLTLARPCVYVLAPVAVFQLVIALAMWRMDIGFLPDWAAPHEWLRIVIPLASHALRIAAPLVLATIDPWPGNGMAHWLPSRNSSARRIRQQDDPLKIKWRVAEMAMRWSIALTFAGHGINALALSYSFQNLVALSAQKWLGWSPSQISLEYLVRTIGVMDLAVAVLLVIVRGRGIAWWMAFWGLVAAASRVTYSGLESGYHQSFVRAAHAGVPAALAVYWSWRLVTNASTQLDDSESATRDDQAHA